MPGIGGENEGYERHQVIYVTDLVVFGREENREYVLLIRRSDNSDAYPGAWALPGGCVEPDETSSDAARRELTEETGVDIPTLALQMVGVYDQPKRDPRGRVVSAAYTTVLDGLPEPVAGDDAANAEWVLVTEALAQRRLAFDHSVILAEAYAVAAG